MSDPQRPDSVPPEALWIDDEQEWQIGTITRDGKAPRGDCKAWRKDGSLAAIYTLDAQGRVQGVNTRFHPDGSVASRGEWKDGNRFGKFMFQQSEKPTPEDYQANERTWRYEFFADDNSSEQNERWFAKDGTPVTSNGRPLAKAFDMDAVIWISAPEEFVARHAAACFQAFYGKEPSANADAKSLAEFWGLEANELSEFGASWIGFGVESARKFTGNCWEALIEHAWGNVHEELSAVFMGAVCVGSIGDSDQVYVTLFNPQRRKPRANAAYFWTHELYYLDQVIALSLDDFAFASAIHHSHEAERLSDEAAANAWSKLQNKVALPWGLQSGINLVFGDTTDADQEARKSFSSDVDTDGYVRNYFWRAQWLICLLLVDSERNMDDVKECFDKSRNQALDKTRFGELLRVGETIPPTAVYLLWRLFWTQDERLLQCLQAYSKHRARVVLDLVDLIKRFEGGLRGIGGIADVQATRAEFLKLGLFD